MLHQGFDGVLQESLPMGFGAIRKLDDASQLET